MSVLVRLREVLRRGLQHQHARTSRGLGVVWRHRPHRRSDWRRLPLHLPLPAMFRVAVMTERRESVVLIRKSAALSKIEMIAEERAVNGLKAGVSLTLQECRDLTSLLLRLLVR